MTTPVNITADDANIVRTLWHGSPLTVFERLSLVSFLKLGHAVEVYAYGELDVPPGVTLCDAASVLPESDVFSYSDGPAKGYSLKNRFEDIRNRYFPFCKQVPDF